MYINSVKSVGAINYYLCESYRTATGRSGSKVVEKLGNAEEIKSKFCLDENTDILLWCKEYAKNKTLEAKKLAQMKNRTVTIELSEAASKDDKSSIFNAGYLILDSIYHSFGIANICEEIKLSHPHIKGFNLNNVLRTMLFGRIINPSSKLRLADCIANRFIEKNDIEVQHIYRAMDLLNQHRELIQKRLFEYTSMELSDRNVSRLYYDCTNFFTEKELEDCDVSNKSEQWHEEHILRKYGKSKEHRPNPIVQMGLFMDGDGIPLGYCINPGNTNEQVTMKPLEEELLKNFRMTDVIVCTDAGLASYENRKLNNITEDDPMVHYGLSGERHYICVQSIKGLNSTLKEWALDRKGWSFTRKLGNKTEKVSDFNLDTLTEDKYAEYYDVVFYKERTIADKNLDQRLIMSFSIKFMEYQKKLRERKIKRAQKMIDNGTFDHEQELSPKSLIEKVHTTKSGDVATKTKAFINQDKIENDAEYDGFYCTATNLFKNKCSIEEVIAISQRRWEIEECFRIMKTDLKSRPFFHNKDSRIKAHFQTCFMALLLIRGIERKIADNNPSNSRFPNGKYTVPDILDALRNINLISIADGKAYMPDYNNSELISELLKIFDLEDFSKQCVMKDNLKKILKKVKKSPEMIKNKK